MPDDCKTAGKAQKAVEKSLKRLKCDYIDFYHVWCIRRFSEYELAMRPGGQYEGLLRCKEKGLIRHIAVSSHLRGPEIVKLIEKGQFEGILLGVNILNFLYRWEGIQSAAAAGMGVAAMNPLAGGVIPQNEDKLGFLAGENETATEAALRFCISCPQITITLVGFSSREHIDTACRAAGTARPFSAEDIERIKRRLSSSMDQLCTGCGYCMGHCPRDIPIAAFMQYYNDKLLAGRTDAEMAKELDIQKQWGPLADRRAEAKDCTKCGRCELACTQHLDIIKRLETIAEWESDNG
jgi:predicted aldo/keto reductase-like oxidoreductase